MLSALGLVALLTAGTASAEAADAQFLGALQQQGIGFGDTQSAITVAHHTCDALSQGMTSSDISNTLAGTNARIDRQTAVLIVVDAAKACCPSTYTRWPTAQRSSAPPTDGPQFLTSGRSLAANASPPSDQIVRYASPKNAATAGATPVDWCYANGERIQSSVVASTAMGCLPNPRNSNAESARHDPHPT